MLPFVKIKVRAFRLAPSAVPHFATAHPPRFAAVDCCAGAPKPNAIIRHKKVFKI